MDKVLIELLESSKQYKHCNPPLVKDAMGKVNCPSCNKNVDSSNIRSFLDEDGDSTFYLLCPKCHVLNLISVKRISKKSFHAKVKKVKKHDWRNEY
jgi:ssDNA-binding Zn-finger/Zn-ribbon topoisomerase 1